ncbi:MAG TPA: hypothetical protein VM536_18710 [Chloroflexia bacterium]|nr:hypothetical protein [Chloroflexia bacterium]
MLQELVRDIYETASMDWASSEKIAYAMLQFLERKLPPDDFAHIQKYILGHHTYTMPPSSGYVGYDNDPPDQFLTGQREMGTPAPPR